MHCLILRKQSLKVKIGKYKNWFGPYQLAELLCFWVKKVPDECGIMRHPDWVHDFGTWLSGGEDKESLLYKFLLWVDSKKKRTIKIHIDKWDTWSMDHTLALIILPMLKQLKETKHGAPLVDDEDVPKHLRSTTAPAKENKWDVDDNHFKRWDWVIDEMIFAFEHKADVHGDWENKFFVNDKYDKEGHEKIAKRIDNGFKLFGKYYQGLWD